MDTNEKIARYEEIERRGLLHKLPQEKQDLWAEYKRRQAKNTSSGVGAGDGAIATLDQGATFGFGKKLGGLMNAIGSYPVDRVAEFMGVENTPSFKDRYNEIVEPANKAREQFAKEHPVASLGTEIAGSLVNKPVNMAFGAASKLGGLKKYASLLGLGGATAAADTTGRYDTMEEFKNNIGFNTALGAGLSVALPGAVDLVGAFAPKVLGATTGAGEQSIRTAYKAGKKPTKANSSFKESLRGTSEFSETADKAMEKLGKLQDTAEQVYKRDIAKVPNAAIDFNDVTKIYNKTLDSFTPQGKEYLRNKNVQKFFNEVGGILENLSKDTDLHSIQGIDSLKKAIKGISVKGDDKVAQAAKAELYDNLNSLLRHKSSKYARAMDNYSSKAKEISDIKNIFSLNNNSSTDTKLRKLQSVTRNNVNTNYGAREQLLKALDQNGEIIGDIAGQALRTWEPRGLTQKIANYMAVGGAIPSGGTSLLYTLAASPRFVGETAYGLGRIAPYTGKLRQIKAYTLNNLNKDNRQ